MSARGDAETADMKTAIVHGIVLVTGLALAVGFLFYAFEAFEEDSLSGSNNGECRQQLMSRSADYHSTFSVTTICTDRAKRLLR